MTETERMKAGLIYDCSCDEIMQKQTGYVQYMKEYNTLGLGDEKKNGGAFAVDVCPGR